MSDSTSAAQPQQPNPEAAQAMAPEAPPNPAAQTAAIASDPQGQAAAAAAQVPDPQRVIERARVDELKAQGFALDPVKSYVVRNRNGVPYFTSTDRQHAEDRLVELAAGSFGAGPTLDAEPEYVLEEVTAVWPARYEAAAPEARTIAHEG